jgi:hypothetical protein
MKSFHNLYTSPKIVGVMKSSRIVWDDVVVWRNEKPYRIFGCKASSEETQL